MIKKAILFNLLLLSALLFFLPQRVAEFSLAHLVKSTHNEWSLHPSLDFREVRLALEQKFIYSGCGAQVHVLFSEDGKTVLKLFKKKRYEVPLWIRLMPPNPYKSRKLASKKAKVIREFSSYRIAFDELEEETALLFVHLDRKVDQVVTIVDEKGKSHSINLGDYAFILQKRGELACSYIERLVREGDAQGAKEALVSLLDLLKGRIRKGIADTDPSFGKNFAFLGGKAVQIDIGRFGKCDGEVRPPRIPKKFKVWLQDLSPELYSFFEEKVMKEPALLF